MVTKRSVPSVAGRMRATLDGAEVTRQSAAKLIGISVATLRRRLTGQRRLLVEDVIATSLIADIAPSALLADEADR